MKWASAITETASAQHALQHLHDVLIQRLGGDEPDLVLLFWSPHYSAALATGEASWPSGARGSIVLGCSAGGVVGEAHEIEQRRGFAAVGACLPGVQKRAFSLRDSEIDDAWSQGSAQGTWADFDADAHVILLTDPFSFDCERFLGHLDTRFPGGVTVGGIASGGTTAGAVKLLCGTDVHSEGGVGVILSGDLCVHAIVAQGCRPIGEPMLVSQHDGNRILKLGDRSPLAVLRDLYEALQPRDQALFRTSLFIGVEMTDRVEYKHGDFLIRQIIGMDPETEGIAINAHLKPWQVVQFHLRDDRTSRADLDGLLKRFVADHPEVQPAGALMFSCLGRGLHLYKRPDHDTDLFREHMGEIPLAGFFCNGELGPVGAHTFLHGYTSVFALFSPRAAATSLPETAP